MSKESIIIARQRNWLKYRLIGIGTNLFQLTSSPSISDIATKDIITEEERGILTEMDNLRLKLLDNWNKNSVALGMKPKYSKEKIQNRLGSNEDRGWPW